MKKLVLMLMFAVVGCSLLPRQAPDNREAQAAQAEAKTLPGMNLAQGYVLLAQVRALAADGLKVKLITVEEAKKFLEMTDAARTALDTARDMYLGGSPDAAEKGLAIAQALIQQVRQEAEAKIRERNVQRKP